MKGIKRARRTVIGYHTGGYNIFTWAAKYREKQFRRTTKKNLRRGDYDKLPGKPRSIDWDVY